MPKRSYQQNPSREANIVIGGGLGVLLGGVLLGFPGALVGGGIGAVLGSERGDTRRRLLENQARCPRGTQVQTLIFDRFEFPTAQEAQRWARQHGYKSTKVDMTVTSFRLRQKLPSSFTRSSFRTIKLTNGVKAVIGCPRRQ
jgi:hypothetical protein